MFMYCEELEELPEDFLNVYTPEQRGGMFYACHKLHEYLHKTYPNLDIPPLDKKDNYELDYKDYISTDDDESSDDESSDDELM